MIEHSTSNRNVLGSIQSGVEVLNDVNSKLPVDRVNMVEFGYHGQ